MMDLSVSGGASGAEAAAAAKSAKAGKGDAAGQKGDFSDVLAKASGSTADDAPDNAQPDQSVADGDAGKVARTLRSRSGAKPLIDLSDAALKAQADVQPETIANGERAAAKHAKDGLELPAGVGKLDAEDQSADEAARSAKGVKHGKTEISQTDKATDSEDDDGGISDVLGLLKQEPADGTVTLPAAAAAHQASIKAAEAGHADKQTAGIDAKTTGHASDALTVVNGSAESIKADDIRVPGAENTEATDGRTFRISRADGRGVSMDVHLGASRPDRRTVRRRPMSKTSLSSSRAAISAWRRIRIPQRSPRLSPVIPNGRVPWSRVQRSPTRRNGRAPARWSTH